jgi:hypothetical protein
MPFHPHKEAATLDLGAQNAPAQAYQQALDSELELKRVQATIMHVRSSIYQTYDQVNTVLLLMTWACLVLTALVFLMLLSCRTGVVSCVVV